MAKKNIPTKKTGTKSAKADVIQKKKKLSSGSLAVIITAIVLAVAILTPGIIHLVGAINEDKWFDYAESDMNDYIKLPETLYKNYDLELTIAKPHYDIDIDVALLNLISSAEYRKLLNDGAGYKNIAVTAGDKILLRYRGYTLDKDGNKKVVSTAMSNITYESATEIQIGESNTYLPIGFELGLLGKNPEDYAAFEKITSGTPEDGWVVYVSGKRVPIDSLGTDNEKKDTYTLNYMRIDLTDKEDTDKAFGEGFTDLLKGFNIGQSYAIDEIEVGAKKVKCKYTDLKINFATTCEKDETSENGKPVLTVEGYFAYDYGIDGTATAGLRNEKVYYDVWIELVTPYDTVINGVSVNSPGELTDDVIKFIVNESSSTVTEEELNTYEGATLVEKYRNVVKKFLDEAYEESLEAMIESKLWDKLLKNAEVLKYPKIKLDAVYKEYEDDVYYQFEYTGGSLSDSSGNYTNYDTVDKFACAYLSLAEGSDWKATLKTMCESLVKERLILFYILQNEALLPTDEVLNKKVEEIKKEYLDEYIEQYIAQKEANDEDFKREDLVGDKYDEFVEERKAEIFDYYDDDYFKETAYYDIALEYLVKQPTVYTLDNPKPAEDK